MTDDKNKVQNNNILVDLIIKSSRLQTLLNMLIDVNNAADYTPDKVIITSNQYSELQDLLIKSINLLSNLVVSETNKFREAVNGRDEKDNNDNTVRPTNPDNYDL